MSEERKMILQMVADGKISAEEAEKLMQAIDETEQAAQTAAEESVRTTAGTAGASRSAIGNLGDVIDRTVRDSLRGLDEMMRSLELSLERRVNEQSIRDFNRKIEERMRRSTERAVERAREAQDRAEQVAERATRKAAEHAQRAAKRMEERIIRRAARRGDNFIKLGVAIDRETAQQREQLALPVEPGDRLNVENRIGDVTVSFYEGGVVEVDVKKTVWGEDKADAEERATATKVELVRRGANVDLEIIRPSVVGVGVLITRDTRVDYEIRLPHGMNLNVHNKVGDVRVTAGTQIGAWKLETKVGDIDVTVPAEAGFRYELRSVVGSVGVTAGDAAEGIGPALKGRLGDGSGLIDAAVKTGDIRIHY